METLLACLTPPGKAAIATIAVRGPHAWDVTRQLFTPAKGTLPDQPIVGRCWFGRLGDDVILAVKDVDSIELHCHGGIEVVRMIQELYEQHAVRVVPWQPFVAEAKLLELLTRAPTTRTASILLDQWSGAWQSADPHKRDRLRELIPLGRHLVEPWKVVIAGAPNVGKSSLMNALAGYTRSVVSPPPGPTRDVVTVQLAIDGWPITLTDTAGLRAGSSDLEQQGIKRARAVLRDADLRLWLVDGSTAPIWPDDTGNWCIVINKTDLPAAWDPDEGLLISARTQAGLPELCELISRRLVPQPPTPGEAVPCLPEQVEWVLAR